jgi:precorrin-6B methylase 2
MKSAASVLRSIMVISILMMTIGIFAQEQSSTNVYEPRIGQKGKDVVWVPTPQELVNKMLEIAQVTPADFVIDLGSGDGRTVITAAKLGARALGIEFNPDMVNLSRENAKKEGVADLTEFIEGDLYEADLSDATVITMFLLPEINLKLRPKLLDLKPGTRIVTNTFTMGDWVEDLEVTTEENWNSWNQAHLWIIPAKVEGRWKMGKGELNLKQKYQMVEGIYTSAGKSSLVKEGKLRGEIITFTINDQKYTGRIEGKRISGTTVNITNNKAGNWTAAQRLSD